MVPGNHDVNRKRILTATKMIHRRLRQSALPEAKLELGELAAQNGGALMEKLTDYEAFASTYGCHFESPSRPRWSRLFPLEGDLMLKFVGLTTVQVSDIEDQKGALLLGAYQYVYDRIPRVEVVVVMHHPPEWIKDRPEAFQYLDSRARVQIFGHEHFQQIESVSNVNQESRLVICSGAVTPENAAAPYIYRYNVINFALAGDAADPCLSVTIFPRVWLDEGTRFVADTGRIGGRESTTFTLGCPQFKLPPDTGVTSALRAGAVSPALDQEMFARTNYFFWRYLTWQQQLRVLVEIDLLPTMSEAPSLLTLVRMALERAKTDGKLAALWDRMMTFVPEEKRETNPFNT